MVHLVAQSLSPQESLVVDRVEVWKDARVPVVVGAFRPDVVAVFRRPVEKNLVRAWDLAWANDAPSVPRRILRMDPRMRWELRPRHHPLATEETWGMRLRLPHTVEVLCDLLDRARSWLVHEPPHDDHDAVLDAGLSDVVCDVVRRPSWTEVLCQNIDDISICQLCQAVAEL